MPSTPLLIGLTIEQPADTAKANIQVTCRNETTNESKTDNTASDGKVIFNVGDLSDYPAGWNVGDKINVFSLYTGWENSFSFTIPSAGTTITLRDTAGVSVGSFIGGQGMTNGILVLTESPASPSLRYYTSQEFLDYYNLKTKDIDAENGINLLQLNLIGQQVEQEIDSLTNSKFDNNSGSYYSSSAIEGGESPEYHDARSVNQKEYFTDFIPINSVTTFQINQNAEGGTPNWATLTEASNEIAIDKATGRISIVNSAKYAQKGTRHVRITYVFGRSSAPQDIKLLAIMMTGRRMVQSAFIKSRILKLDETNTGDVNEFTNFRNRIIRKYRNHTLIAS